MSLSSKELMEVKFVFKSFDADGDGHISSKELADALQRLNITVTEQKLKSLIDGVDKNKNGQIEFDEFVEMVKGMRSAKEGQSSGSELGDVLKKTKVLSVQGQTGQHSFTQDEVDAFTEHINNTLKGDPDLPQLPLKDLQLFEAVQDGVLLCKLIHAAFPDTIDPRVINTKKKKNAWEINENHNLAIQSAKGIGCVVVNITPESLTKGTPHIVLGLVWQIIKLGLMADITLTAHPELVCLLQEGETIADLMALPPEQLLLRWFNYQLNKAGSKKRVTNFSGDIKDSEAYTILLKQICPNGECDMSPMNESNLTKRAELMLQQADKIDCRKFVTPDQVVKGNPKLNLAFVANLFNKYPNLEEIDKNDYAELLDFDAEGTREERAFRFWIQSLGIDCNNLYADLRDGVILLKVEDKVQPGIVDWKKVNMTPKNKYQKVENVNKVVEIAKKLKLSTVNIGGTDILDGKKKLILAIVWQLMRQNLLNMLKELGGGKPVDDKDVLEWANSKVSDMKIDSFRDSSLKTGVYLCRLCAAIAPRSVNNDLITSGETDEDAEKNAKYAISVARKLGCSVFLLWEDIVEVKPKMILAFVASLMIYDKSK